MEILAILLIFSLGVIMLGGCFIGGIAFVISVVRKFLTSLFGKNSSK